MLLAVPDPPAQLVLGGKAIERQAYQVDLASSKAVSPHERVYRAPCPKFSENPMSLATCIRLPKLAPVSQCVCYSSEVNTDLGSCRHSEAGRQAEMGSSLLLPAH